MWQTPAQFSLLFKNPFWSMSETSISEPAVPVSSSIALPVSASIYVATSAEVHRNLAENDARTWCKEGSDPNSPPCNYASQRLQQTWFTPTITPKFKLQRDDKVYAIGSCFARGLENSLIARKIAVESAAPEFARLQPVNREASGLGFINKYNTFSILNELRWALDPNAVFPVDSIVQVTDMTWSDPHTTPKLKLAGLEETLERRSLMRMVTKRIVDCRAAIITLGLVEVWRDVQTDVYINYTPLPALLKTQPGRYEFHLTSFTENWANLEAIHALLSRYGHPELRIVVTVSPVPLQTTFSKMDVVVANTYSKSLLRTVAQEWAAAHDNVDYFPSYEIVQNSDRAAVWQPDLRHVRAAVAHHITELFLHSYLR
jgi:hypothetical protein